MSIRYFKYILLIFLFLSPLLYAADPPLPTPVGRVVWVKGTLKATMPNHEERVLQKTSLIYLHDTLTTDVNSQAQIVFTDNTLMTFRPGSKFVIDQYTYNPQAKKGSVGRYIMNLIEGGFRTITGLIAKSNPGDYQINTPVATIGVRGTDYAVAIQNGEVFMGYYGGTPCVNNSQGSLCLSPTNQFAKVSSSKTAPVALSQQPAVFKEKQLITPAKIAPFAGPGATKEGSITSFCITQ